MTKEEADIMREAATFALDALDSCGEDYDHEGGSFQCYDEDKVKLAKAMLRNVKVFKNDQQK